jgi:hypothetical protein
MSGQFGRAQCRCKVRRRGHHLRRRWLSVSVRGNINRNSSPMARLSLGELAARRGGLPIFVEPRCREGEEPNALGPSGKALRCNPNA